jgi:uncharacterized protein
MAEQVLGANPTKARAGLSATLWLFLALVAAGSAVLNVMIIRAGGVREAGALVAGIMCVPALAAVVALLATRRSLAGVGWGLGRVGFIGLAILLPVLIVTPVYAALWASGLAGLDLQEWSVLVEENFGWRLAPAASVLAIASIGLLIDSVVAAGEEIGWRGLLLPELARGLSLPLAALVTGAIWAVWHYPGILFGGYASESAPVWYSLASFTIMALGWSMVLAWLRFASGSVWPAALMHGAHNIFIQAVLDPVTQDASGITPFVSGEFGLGVAFAYVVAGLVAWRALARMQRRG